MEDIIDDTSKFVLLTELFIEKTFSKKLPKFICGSSMGGLIVHYVSKKHNFNGVIYVAPCFNIEIGCFTKLFVKSLACCCPQTNIPKNPTNTLSKNPIIKIEPDPIMTERPAKLGTLNALLQQCKLLTSEINKSHENSILIIVPGVDKLVSFDDMINYYEQSEVKDKTIWLYPNMWHVVLLEEEIVDIMPRLNVWMKERIPSN